MIVLRFLVSSFLLALPGKRRWHPCKSSPTVVCSAVWKSSLDKGRVSLGHHKLRIVLTFAWVHDLDRRYIASKIKFFSSNRWIWSHFFPFPIFHQWFSEFDFAFHIGKILSRSLLCLGHMTESVRWYWLEGTLVLYSWDWVERCVRCNYQFEEQRCVYPNSMKILAVIYAFALLWNVTGNAWTPLKRLPFTGHTMTA